MVGLDMFQHFIVCFFFVCQLRWWRSVWNGHLTDWNHTSKSKWPGITHASGLACKNQCCEPSWQPSLFALCLAAGCNVCKPWGIRYIIQVQCGQPWIYLNRSPWLPVTVQINNHTTRKQTWILCSQIYCLISRLQCSFYSFQNKDA